MTNLLFFFIAQAGIGIKISKKIDEFIKCGKVDKVEKVICQFLWVFFSGFYHQPFFHSPPNQTYQARLILTK